MVPKMALIWGNGGLIIRFYVCDPKKAHPWVEPRVLAYFASKSVLGPWLLQVARTPPPKKTNTFWVCNLVRKVTHARKRNPWANRDELLHRCMGPRCNHLCQFLWFPHTGFERGGGGQILGFSIDLHRRPYNTLALPCECVMDSRQWVLSTGCNGCTPLTTRDLQWSTDGQIKVKVSVFI